MKRYDTRARSNEVSVMSYRSGRHFLQIPGPTNVPDRVLRAIDAPTYDDLAVKQLEAARRLSMVCAEADVVSIYRTLGLKSL